MRRKVVAALAVLVVWSFMVPASLHADYFDNFNDGDPNGDPSGWDIDNPGWRFYNPLGCTVAHDIVGDYKALRLFADMALIPQVAYFAICDDGLTDPNASATYWDDTTNHYMLVRAYYRGDVYGGGDPNDPNNDIGQVTVLFHADEDHWTTFKVEWTLHNCAYNKDPNDGGVWSKQHWYTQHCCSQSLNGTDFQNFQRLWMDPNGTRAYGSADPNTADANDTRWLEPPENSAPGHRIPALDTTRYLGIDQDSWERQGLWLLAQFERDPNYASGDPNGKFIKAAYWTGDKYDWDGVWDLDRELSDSWWGSSEYWPEGKTAIAVLTANYALWGAGFPTEVAYDDIEVRTGLFTNVSRNLALTVKNSQMGTITIDPDLRDPNDPNEPGSILGRYTNGTEIVMVAEAISGKSFKQWKIFDPNHPGDSGYAVIDTNTTLYLTMDADWEIEASFKCGSSEGLVPLGVVLLTLALAVCVRRYV